MHACNVGLVFSLFFLFFSLPVSILYAVLRPVSPPRRLRWQRCNQSREEREGGRHEWVACMHACQFRHRTLSSAKFGYLLLTLLCRMCVGKLE